ncbi:MAG: hypothetical protein ACFCUX_08440 [Candidatus Methylacidiphilales bacterium]
MSSTTVRLSKQLVDSAKEIAVWNERSVPGQLEHWALLGKAIEEHLPPTSAIALKKSAALEGKVLGPEDEALVLRLLEALRKSMPSTQVSHSLAKKHRFLYEADPLHPDLLIQVDSNGKKTPGKMVNRRFVPQHSEK